MEASALKAPLREAMVYAGSADHRAIAYVRPSERSWHVASEFPCDVSEALDGWQEVLPMVVEMIRRSALVVVDLVEGRVWAVVEVTDDEIGFEELVPHEGLERRSCDLLA